MDAWWKPGIENINGRTIDCVNNCPQTWSLPETIAADIIIICTYLTLVLKILPALMKNRPPYKLSKLLICYNAFQVFYSSYLVFIYTRYIIKHGIFPTRCPQGDPLKPVIKDIFPYFLAKHVDLLDTVFFVLRKKENQVTFLHVYHHSVMVTWAWLYYAYKPSDHFVVVGLINSFVHVLMYAYYGLSSQGPRFAKFIWWKKHLTKIQLIQFILVVFNMHYQQKLTPCPIPFFFHYFGMLSICSFFFLFLKFYLKSYVKQSKNIQETKTNCKDIEHNIAKNDVKIK
ncbi:unnamed protein product [Parnassius mnemosyne]|uniref:Elongation of very long chain fatty acids protein n=1 Tax=Parnassius mnemosyne TaxID=213953 RepID=A0AAV1MBU3_9NEOP